MAADPLIGYEFETEDGTAQVTGVAPGEDSQYLTVVVTPSVRAGRAQYSTVRLRSMVEAHRAWAMGAGEAKPDA